MLDSDSMSIYLLCFSRSISQALQQFMGGMASRESAEYRWFYESSAGSPSILGYPVALGLSHGSISAVTAEVCISAKYTVPGHLVIVVARRKVRCGRPRTAESQLPLVPLLSACMSSMSSDRCCDPLAGSSMDGEVQTGRDEEA